MDNHNTASDILIMEIREQSEKEAASLLELADNEKKRILDEAKEEADSIRMEILKKAEEKAETIKKKVLSGVHLELKNQDLCEREKMFSDIFLMVQKKLTDFRESNQYISVLKILIFEGMEALDVDDVIVKIGKVENKLLTHEIISGFQKEIEKQMNKKMHITISGQILEDGGAIIMSADERIMFDNSFSARFKRMQTDMRQIIITNTKE